MYRSTVPKILLLLFAGWPPLSAQDGTFDWQQGRELQAGIRLTRVGEPVISLTPYDRSFKGQGD